MNRQYYCRLSCWEELRDMLLELEELGEPIQQDAEDYVVYEDKDSEIWCWLGFNEYDKQWALLKYEPDDGTLVDSEDLVVKVKYADVKRNVMKPFPVDKAYWKLRCIKETTDWYSGNPHKTELHKRFYPGDITWYVFDTILEWKGGDEYSIHPENNKYGINYKQSDFELLEIVDPTKEKETHKFEKDKWYKSNVASEGWYYIKVKTYSEYEVRGECIRPVKSNPYHEKDYWNSESSREQALEIGPLTDLSEIQQYLPDGHPDKISKEFVLPEKWVVCPRVEENLKLIKAYFNSFSHHTVTYEDNAYTSDGKYYTNLKCCPKEYTEITFEQFKKYVLKEEKEEAPEKVRKFKLGDTIYLVKDRGRNAPKGSSAKVVGYDDKHVHVEWIDTKGKEQNNGKYYKKDFSLENPMKEEFKIGEWIATTNKSHVSYGKIVQVKNIDGGHIHISPGGWWERKDVRKATPEEIASVTETEEPYKVGDWVKLVSKRGSHWNNEGDMDYLIGKIVQLTGIRDRFIYFKELGGWALNLTDIERKAYPSEILTGTSSCYIPEIGDYVVITGNNNRSVNRVGDVGIVTEVNLGVYRVQVSGRDTSGNLTLLSDMRKAKPDEIPTDDIKVGDWVYAEKENRMDMRDDEFIPVFKVQEISIQGQGSVKVLRPVKGKSSGISSEFCRKALPHETSKNVEWKRIERLFPSYIEGIDPIPATKPLVHFYGSGEPKSLLDREEIEVTIKKTVPKQFSIF